ncbi:glycoside hydrolase [Aestuariibaculum sp. M13]|uniref:MGH1-like glycoside hydrolase domain-containing protein n=1 Tax=Aestuariibaculum sp. M13 TaxID=2967132 RepID=UPI002159EF97|nr:glycosyl hydrolase family 65 protein [Aestuariibaculum sp. M13]MCR8666748.1 glycoside hydrolase [Aestuariibaculum sp. M13]
MNKIKSLLLVLPVLIAGCKSSEPVSEVKTTESKTVLQADDFKHYADYFNRMEKENIAKAVPNDSSWSWMKTNIPLFECPQDNFQEMYYFRWWSLRKHITDTPVGYAITEFLVDRSYADKYNLIACALGHHIYEFRWAHDPKYIEQNVHVWYRGNEGKPMGKLHKFSSWTADALYNMYLVNKDENYLLDMFPDMVSDYAAWENERQNPNGLFWQHDVKDGMEESLSGGRRVQNMRPTINSYMYANAKALSTMARMKGDSEKSVYFDKKAKTLKGLVETKLWNTDHEFFETLTEKDTSSQVREAIGFIPWYFNLPSENKGFEVAWEQVKDEGGFLAPYGLTTAERRHPRFRTHGTGTCEWDGAVWPFASAQTLTAMANLLNNYNQEVVGKGDYFNQMNLYVESQYHRGRPYIGEYLDEVTGYWLMGDRERSYYYNHSTFNDLMITGLVGLRPRADEKIEVNPLIPQDKWDWFCLDNVLYHGDIITILWDKTGEKYHKGQGLRVFRNGKEVASSSKLEKVISE